MGISVIGGSTSTLTGTPVLQIQRANFSSAQAGFTKYSGDEIVQSYTLSTPLPAGNYFITLTTAGNVIQAVGILDNATTAFNILQTSAGTNSTSIAVASGRTLTRIAFQRNPTGNWPSSMTLNILASTDTASWSGMTKGSNNTSFNLPALPAGYVDLCGGNTLNTSRISLDGTKAYVMAMVSTARSKNISWPTTSFSDSNTLNSQMKFYEYDFTTGALTEKAQPVFNATTTCSLNSWAPGLSGNGHSASIYHFAQCNTYVTPTYVYFDPGFMDGSYATASFYYSVFEYGQMGRYNRSTNTWTAVSSPRYSAGNILSGCRDYFSRATGGDKLVVGSGSYMRSSYFGPDTIQSYQNSWVTFSYKKNVDWYSPTANTWYGSAITANAQVAKYFQYGTFPCTDKYAFCDPYSSGQSGPGTQTYSMEVIDMTSTGSRKTIPVSGMYIFGSSGISVGSFNFFVNNWAKHPTDSTRLYIQIKDNPIWYEFLADSYGAQTSTGTASYLIKTKWRDQDWYTYQSNYGWHYNPYFDKLFIDLNNWFNFTTSAQSDRQLFFEILPIPTEMATL